MKRISEQVWVTSALNDSDVPNALALCFSLRRSATSRKVAVIVAPGVSKVLREALDYSFDFVFSLQEDRNTVGLKNSDFVTLFAFTLKTFKKCVILAPNMLVLKNSDELFEWAEENGQHYAWTKNQDMSIVVIRPSLHEFDSLLKGLENNDGIGMNGDVIATILGNKTRTGRYIDDKYNRKLFVETGLGLENCKEVSIVNLPDKFNGKMATESMGVVGQVVLNLWKSIHSGDVEPLLAGLNNPSAAIPDEHLRAYENDAIAVIGMSCRYPGANNLEEFWNILLEGKDATGNPPEFRWLREHCSKNTKPGYRKTNAGFLKCPVGDFDVKFFGLSPKEVECMDPQHRLLLELVWEGLEDAAINPQTLEGTDGGVFIGSWTNDFKEALTLLGAEDFYRRYMGNSIGAGAARISHILGLTGPSIATESGCSSAMVAVHLACKSLERGETNVALACGVNLLLYPFDQDAMPMVLAGDGHCKTFDAKADGFARAEGVGVLVFKRVSDAIRDGDNIWGLIRGSGMTQEGVSKSMGTPTVHCESLAMKKALEDANVDPAMVSYVETHGTGTAVGDPMEVAAIAKAYHSKERKEPLLIGSVKTNVGHTESCSGITGIMKVLLAMKYEIIPPHRNFETLNPAIDLDAVPAKIPLEPLMWPKQQGTPRIAGVSSFGITGTDAHAIIEEPPKTVPSNMLLQRTNLERPLQLIKISAKTDEALQILLESYKAHFSATSDELKDIAFTSNIGRADFSHRAVIIAKSAQDAVKNIEQNKLIRGEESREEGVGKICFLFTGQGSQYPGMAKQLFDTSPVFRMHFRYCDQILKDSYQIDITKILWSNHKSAEVSRTIYSQTSIFCVEYALLKLWESWGVKPDYVLGHSLGEFAAAVCAKILSVEDALKLVAERSLLIDELPRGKMLVIKADKERVNKLIKEFISNNLSHHLDVAAINSEEQTVVAGDSELILAFSEYCKNSNLKCIVLEASHAFHSQHMDPMLDEYRKVAKTVTKLGGNTCEYISGLRGTLVEVGQVGAEYWVDHTREKVLFLEASKKAVELGCRTFIEIGPQPVLSALTMMNNDLSLTCLASLKKNENEWETLLNTLGKLYVAGLKIDWMGFNQFLDHKKVRLPHYPFIGKKYWPESMETTGFLSLHPLLGSAVSNATSTKLFQSGLNVRAAEYVKDHVIGEKVIFPGAGFLEMCLAAGLASVEGSTDFLARPTRAMKVENLTIEAPLLIDESKTSQLQTVVELNTSTENDGDWNDMKISIFRKVELTDSRKWLPHAKALFSPVPTADEKCVPFDSTTFLETLANPSNEDFTEEIYNKLATVGLKFGPSFRSLEKVWRNEEAPTMLAKVKVPAEEDSSSQVQYIIHPVVLDAMIQSIMMLGSHSNLKKKLYVPIKIGKFLWLSAPTAGSTDLFIHSFNPEANPSSGSALLLDSAGKVLAAMSSVDLIETTVKAIDSVLEQQTNCMPDLFEEVWKSSGGPLQFRGDWSTTRVSCVELGIIQEDSNTPAPHLAEIFCKVEQLVYLQLLRALYQRGWEPCPGHTFEEGALAKQLGVQSNYNKYFNFVLKVFESEGVLEKCGEGESTWKISSQPPSLEETERALSSSEFKTELSSKYSTTLLLNKVGETLGEILCGKQPALNILFPDESQGYPSVTEFYSTYDNLFLLTDSIIPKIRKWSQHVKYVLKEQKFVMRVLEVGAGTGSITECIINVFEEEGVEFEYTFTDISPAFFPAAEKKFEKYGKRMRFKKLNIEVDPIEQGFCPEYYDFVCASDVIHATKDIRESLRNIRSLMTPHARFDIFEMTRVHRFITYLFGLLDGFWRFEDLDLRSDHCTLSQESWRKVLNSCGFEVDGLFPILNGHHSYIWTVKTAELLRIPEPEKRKYWLLFHQKGEQDHSQVSTHLQEVVGKLSGRRVISVTAGEKFAQLTEAGLSYSFLIRSDKEEDYSLVFKSLKAERTELEGIVYCWALGINTGVRQQEEILRPYFYLTKSLVDSGLAKLPRLFVLTSGAVPVGNEDLTNFPQSTLWGFTKSLKHEHNNMGIKILDVEAGPLNEKQLGEIFYEMWNFDKEYMLAYREGKRLFPKFQPHKPTSTCLKLPPATDRFMLVLPESKTISDLEFGPLDSCSLKEDEVEVQVKASALNFRDVLSVIKPTEQFKDINAVGFDMAGVVKRVGEKVTKWKVGDRVFGCNTNLSALPSHVQVKETHLLPLPDNMPFCEGATIPAVYFTSIVCLLDVAKIKKGDTVLLHTASGGVGLSAIEICKYIGCTIITTAGSKRKQNYLRSLGIQHIFHSRNTKYGDQILELTNGRGVDVVLNSLTSEGFKEATLKACKIGARFVEMSKLNIWKKEEVKELRPDVEYTIVDISASDESETGRLLDRVKELQKNAVVKPIPYVQFDALNIREALHYMQKAKHVGKIVCVLPELRNEGGQVEVNSKMFHGKSTYLITGGLGGIGLVVCQWMVEKGAKHVILAGRSAPSHSTQNKINELNASGANVVPVQLDVGNFEECRELLLAQISEMGMPPLKGIMHAAGTLADGLIFNQDWDKLCSTFHPKIDGTLNLHELTKNLNLEHFVVFSSMAALFGPPGQCNHAAGNNFEDAFTHYRHSMGLPATTINWGQWGQVGIATEVDLPGVKTISNLQGVTALEYALKAQHTQLAVMNVDSFQIMSKLFPHLSVYLDERIWKLSNASASVTIKSAEFWQQYDSIPESEGRVELVKTHLKNILRNTLKLEDTEEINDDCTFEEMGVDSLMFVEIKNSLQATLGERVTINASALKDCKTINLLGNALVRIIDGNNELENEVAPALEEISELIREDCVLPEYIRVKAGQQAKSIRDIRTVLLTGATGTLGAYVLKELSSLDQIERVFCLVRPRTTETVDERLQKVLESKCLLSKVNMDKITAISGNVTLRNLGMSADIWEEMIGKVDAVFNCSARVQHTEFYRKRNSESDTRAVNIGGMKNLLEFACEGKLKQFCHVSSLLAVATLDEEDGSLTEVWPEIEDYDNVTRYAYPISKFVCDYLAKEAVGRGIPLKVIRLPLITGEEESGRCDFETNHAMLRYVFIMKAGCMPNTPLPVAAVPVDMCANACTRLFFDERAFSDVYNIGPCDPDVDQNFVHVAKLFGCEVEVVELAEFLKRVHDEHGENSILKSFKEHYNDDGTVVSSAFATPALIESFGRRDVFRSKKVAALIPDFYEKQRATMDYVYNDLMFLKDQGWLKKFGL